MNQTHQELGRAFSDARYSSATDRMIQNGHSIISIYADYLEGKEMSTITRYVNIATDFMNYAMKITGKTEIEDIFEDKNINPVTIRHYIKTPRKASKDKVSSATFNLRRIELNAFFEFLVKMNLIDKSLCTPDQVGIVKNRVTSVKTNLTKEDIGVILKNIQHPERLSCKNTQKKNIEEQKEMWMVFINLAIITGARFAELANLTYQDINREECAIYFTQKGGSIRVNSITPQTVKMLDAYRPIQQRMLQDIKHKWETGEIVKTKSAETLPEDQLFFTLSGSRLDNKQTNRKLKILSEGVDKPVTCHILRHTCANLLLDGGFNVNVVKDVLGHKNITTTQRYLHTSDDQKRRAADKIEQMFHEMGVAESEKPLEDEQRWDYE